MIASSSLFKSRSLLRVLALGLVIVASTVPSCPQSGNESSLEGTVTDATGAAMAGVVVTVTHAQSAATFSASTNESGLFRFAVLPVGSYELTAVRAGFATLVQRNIVLSVGTRISLSHMLHLGGAHERVVVSAEVPVVEAARSHVSATVDQRSVASLPVNGRNFLDFALLTPAVSRDATRVGDLTFAGQRGMNSVLVDGVDDNNTFWGQSLGRVGVGRAPFQFSLAAVQEFQVNTNTYSAEFGRAGGGVINMVTRSGTNDFHGSVFWHYRDRSMNANDAVNKLNSLPKSPYHFHQFGGTLGGPVVKDKFFLFTGSDGQRSTGQNLVFLNLPAGFAFSSDARVAALQQRALNYLIPRAASWNFTFDQHTYFAKLDWYTGGAHRLTARWNRQSFTGEKLDSRGQQISFEHTGASLASNDTVAVSLTSTVSPSTVNVARLGYVRSDEPGRADSANPEARVLERGQLVLTIGRNPLSPRENSIRRGELSDTISYGRGCHLLKAGADALLDRIKFFASSNFSGSYRFNSLESFGSSLAGAPAPVAGESYLQTFSGNGMHGAITHPDSFEFAGFAQDEWRPRLNLTFNPGLRYDLQTMAKPLVRNPASALAAAGLDTSFIPADKTNFAPRVGFAWAPLGGSRLVVRGGYGMFYAITPAIMTSRAHFQNGISVQTRTFDGDVPGSAALIPAYPNTLCGAPDPSGAPPNCAAPAAGASDLTILLFDPRYTQPYTQQGSLGVEVQLQTKTAVSLGYLWAKGVHLQRTRDINLRTPTAPTNIGIANTRTVLTYQKFVLPRPIAGFARVLVFESNANSTYHGLVLQMTKRFAQNFEFQGSYTLSKVIDDVPETFAVNPVLDDFRMLSDPSNPHADRSAGINDQRHRFVLSGIWELDYAKRFPSVSKAILGGWELSGILTAQSGQPYSGLVNSDLNNDENSATDRAPGLGRDTFYLPTTVSFDPRVTRNVQLTERVKLQIMWEAFNVFNHANVTGVRTTQYAYVAPTAATSAATCGIAGTPCLVPQNTGLSAFGTPTATSGPRIMQLSARFVF